MPAHPKPKNGCRVRYCRNGADYDVIGIPVCISHWREISMDRGVGWKVLETARSISHPEKYQEVVLEPPDRREIEDVPGF